METQSSGYSLTLMESARFTSSQSYKNPTLLTSQKNVLALGFAGQKMLRLKCYCLCACGLAVGSAGLCVGSARSQHPAPEPLGQGGAGRRRRGSSAHVLAKQPAPRAGGAWLRVSTGRTRGEQLSLPRTFMWLVP